MKQTPMNTSLSVLKILKLHQLQLIQDLTCLIHDRTSIWDLKMTSGGQLAIPFPQKKNFLSEKFDQVTEACKGGSFAGSL